MRPRCFFDPVTAEKRALMAERWSALDPVLRLPGQGLGQKATGCGATMGIQPKCDFSCTGCYLGAEANRIPAMPVEPVLRQLDALRRRLGPKSNVQITDGTASSASRTRGRWSRCAASTRAVCGSGSTRA